MTRKNILTALIATGLGLSLTPSAMANSFPNALTEAQKQANDRETRAYAEQQQREIDRVQREAEKASRFQDSTSPTQRLQDYEANERARKTQYEAEQRLKQKE